jgi:5-aminolevulinate synthase
LIFTSGYVANDAALSTLARELPGMVVFSDASNHASMIAGIRNSRAEKYIFRHNDPADLARLIEQVQGERPKLVCFESVYSMDGDIAPIGQARGDLYTVESDLQVVMAQAGAHPDADHFCAG